MDLQPGSDMLSELPLSIIHDILALVPIRDAVKTSVLSRQWRYTWASLPQLKFEEQYSFREYSISRSTFDDCMRNFITHALLLHRGPIYKFKLSVSFHWKCQSIGAWLLCLSRNDIREIIIDIPTSYVWDAPSTQDLQSDIYSCEKLTRLELNNCELNPPPTTFKKFLFLRSLCLRDVFLSTNEVESLVAKCPILEEFTSIGYEMSELRISAPTLKVLHLSYVFYIKLFVYAPLLAKLWVQFGHKDNLSDSSVCNYANFMGGFTNLEKLHGDYGFTKYLSQGIESCHHTLVFHHLKNIKLTEMEFEDINVISVVARLIASAPNLQKLEMPTIFVPNSFYLGEYFDFGEESFSDFGCAPHVKFEKLRVVKMRYFTSFRLQMALIRFLLERSPVLETVNFYWYYEHGEKEEQKLED